jgi:hypothetical protein
VDSKYIDMLGSEVFDDVFAILDCVDCVDGDIAWRIAREVSEHFRKLMKEAYPQ